MLGILNDMNEPEVTAFEIGTAVMCWRL